VKIAIVKKKTLQKNIRSYKSVIKKNVEIINLIMKKKKIR